jgi:TMEM175 potassium channel family protein
VSEDARHWNTGRVEAFSDGVFAIAITLLVLEIKIEPDQFDDLRGALLEEWPAYLAYVTSFLTVGSVWIAHHNLFSRLRYVDPILLRLNLFLLLAASFLPFPTAVLAESFDASHAAERTAVVFYGAAALVIELLLRGAQHYANSRPELSGESEGAGGPGTTGVRHVLGIVAYSVSILFAVFVFPRVAAVVYLLLAVRGVLVVGGEGRLSISSRRK